MKDITDRCGRFVLVMLLLLLLLLPYCIGSGTETSYSRGRGDRGENPSIRELDGWRRAEETAPLEDIRVDGRENYGDRCAAIKLFRIEGRRT